jgi:anti-sigma regulatory factor (Ser/Thr protein kinase)
MKSVVVIAAAFALLLAACSGSSSDSVVSLDDATPEADVGTEEIVVQDATDEDAILAFAACMRDNGVEDFEDPEVAADGSVQFGFGGGGQTSDVDRETMETARQACGEFLEGVAFGRNSEDRSEIEDQLYEFAACMRDNGYDMPDPDFSAEPGQGAQGGGPFGGAIDSDDPSFQSALEGCEDAFGGTLRFGRGRPAASDDGDQGG